MILGHGILAAITRRGFLFQRQILLADDLRVANQQIATGPEQVAQL
jgi:hypothetical protein